MEVPAIVKLFATLVREASGKSSRHAPGSAEMDQQHQMAESAQFGHICRYIMGLRWKTLSNLFRLFLKNKRNKKIDTVR